LGAQELSTDELARLLRHKGFGNPAGNFWFVGIEERGGGTLEELQARGKFREFEDLAFAHSSEMLNFPMTTLIPTWATMSKIVLRLKGEHRWWDSEVIREYQSERLGRLGGETFLTELLPLPAVSTSHWHYGRLYPSRDEYERIEMPHRQKFIRTLFDQHQPRFVFCYGKGYWNQYEGIFRTSFAPLLDGRLRIGRVAASSVVLTPFFFYFLMTKDVIEGLARELIRRA
jgi:hypothetical protein